jgi:hypothetical protein
MTTTTALATASGTIVALDLGKYKSVACLYDRASAQARFQTIDTTREDLRRLFEQHQPYPNRFPYTIATASRARPPPTITTLQKMKDCLARAEE